MKSEGFTLVAGMDEVGRGPLAGPISIGVVILPDSFAEPVVDSKLLRPEERNKKAQAIRDYALGYYVAHVEPEYIDTYGVTASLREAGRRALKGLGNLIPDVILLDGRHDFLGISSPVRTVIKGDRLSVSIAAASILAKVERDAIMQQYALEYPFYGFDSHMGYGTARHIEAIQQYGPTPIHRQLFLRKIVP